MDIDLAKICIAGVHESMRSFGRDNCDAAGRHYALLVSDGDGSGAVNNEGDLYVRVNMQRRTLSRFGVNDVGRNGRALRYADKFT